MTDLTQNVPFPHAWSASFEVVNVRSANARSGNSHEDVSRIRNTRTSMFLVVDGQLPVPHEAVHVLRIVPGGFHRGAGVHFLVSTNILVH